MSKGRKRKASLADKNDELMAEFRRLRDETQPIREGIAALSPFQNPRDDLSTDTSLLRELQLMRTEIRTEMKQIQNEMKEKLEQIRMEMAEVKNNQEVLKNDQCNLSVQVALLKKDLKKTATENAANVGILKTKIESASAQINVMNEKVSTLKCFPTFRERISGKWKDTDSSTSVSLKFNDKEFIIKWNSLKQAVYTLDVPDSDGGKAEFEGEKMVHSWEDFRREYYLEDGRLIILDKVPEKNDAKFTYMRIGDPDPE